MNDKPREREKEQSAKMQNGLMHEKKLNAVQYLQPLLPEHSKNKVIFW